MDDTVGNEDISQHNLGVVDEDTAVVDGDSQVSPVQGGNDSAIPDGRRVDRLSTNDSVVGKDTGDLLGGEVAKARADSLESGVVGSENGDILSGVDGIHEVGRIESTTERSEASSSGSAGDVLGQSKEAVDHVDDTASEVDVRL